MKLDELRSAQAKERRKDSLQHLRDSFYDDVAAYVSDLRAARDRRAEQVDKPFSDDDVRRMSDEVETAEEVAEALYERRVGKVVKLASFAAADMSVDADGMTTEERQLFDDLVDRISENKSRVLNVLAGEEPPSSAAAVSTDDAAPHEETATAGDEADAIRETDESATTNPAPPAPDPEPPAEIPPGRDDGTANTAETEGSGDALAGAMGGSDEEVADALDAATDVTTDGGSRTADGPTSDGDATAGDGPTLVPPEPAPPGAPGTEGSDGVGPAASDDGATGDTADAAAAAGATDADDTDRTTVRITRDVGSIFGIDEREYDLASEDVVTLPAENAEPLVQRDAAKRLD
ncbi:DNA replication complex subunit Gins51 [Halorubrum sp. N11]|uniref:DNA replication complex subunit Gins51 n=1 Tax=Halorubrum sp. N11 TaxID=3402276 RepID=UPI003EC11CB7